MKSALGIALLFLALPWAQAAETRCGWLENPTPANWWLNDRDGSWTLSTQGGYTLIDDPSWERMPELKDEHFVRTNITYGYTCACLSLTVDRENERVLKIHSGRQLPLKRCLEDPDLPRPGS